VSFPLGHWLPTTGVAVFRPNQPNASGTILNRDAAVPAYGPAFGNPAPAGSSVKGTHGIRNGLHAGIAHTPQFPASSFIEVFP
jgi:hypothetical protein